MITDIIQKLQFIVFIIFLLISAGVALIFPFYSNMFIWVNIVIFLAGLIVLLVTIEMIITSIK